MCTRSCVAMGTETLLEAIQENPLFRCGVDCLSPTDTDTSHSIQPMFSKHLLCASSYIRGWGHKYKKNKSRRWQRMVPVLGINAFTF